MTYNKTNKAWLIHVTSDLPVLTWGLNAKNSAQGPKAQWGIFSDPTTSLHMYVNPWVHSSQLKL